jgi:hypothetical protein
MFRKNCISVALLLAVTVAAEGSSPDLATIEQIEHAVRLPASSYPLVGYDRYYARDTVSGRQVIVGLYLATNITDERKRFEKGGSNISKDRLYRKGEVHLLLSLSLFPDGITDGGCDEIRVYWDVATAKIAGVFCNGLA